LFCEVLVKSDGTGADW